ncbi:MAG: DUF6221 family protein [Marmoricola sp.]
MSQTEPHPLDIREFLLGFATLGEAGRDDDLGDQALWLRDEVRRHTAQVDATGQRAGWPVLHCGLCPPEPEPCGALRLLAVPYANHPAYQADWIPVPTQDPSVIAMPAGLARRRALRTAGLNLRVGDFTDEERAQRGWFSQAQRKS